MDASNQPILRTDSLSDSPRAAEPAAGAALEHALGHRFRAPKLLEQALTHASAGQGRQGMADNERLEFLGDRVLGLIIAELLMERFPGASEGELGPRLTALVRREALAEVARAIDLGRYLSLAPADAASGARDNPKLLADACEAVIAALYLDGGLDLARGFIGRAWTPLIDAVSTMPFEPKTALQEWAQGHGKPLPVYTLTSSSGEAHSPTFEVEVAVEGEAPATASGPSKRAAEKAAALALLGRLGLVPVARP